MKNHLAFFCISLSVTVREMYIILSDIRDATVTSWRGQGTSCEAHEYTSSTSFVQNSFKVRFERRVCGSRSMEGYEETTIRH